MNINENASKEKELNVLRKFLPPEFEHFVHALLFESTVHFKIVNPRNTKLGDFRVERNSKKMQITVNGNLNPYAFLTTTLHEIAHMRVYLKFDNKVKPHGEEWKLEFGKLIYEALQHSPLPKDIENALMRSISSLKASSCTDVDLYRVLKKYDINYNNNSLSIDSLQKNAIFVFRKKRYRLISKRRTRYLCEDLQTGRQYLFHALTEIEKYE